MVYRAFRAAESALFWSRPMRALRAWRAARIKDLYGRARARVMELENQCDRERDDELLALLKAARKREAALYAKARWL